MQKVYVAFDSQFQTWNVMLDGACIFYGTAWQCDDFLIDNKDKYFE